MTEAASSGTAGLLELGAVVTAAGLLARLATRLRLSPIPLYLLAGLAFGRGGLVPLPLSEPFLAIGANLGVLLLLFMLGLEYTGAELGTSLRTGWRAGAVDVALNFTPGALAALALGWGATAAVLLGGVTYISSSGITAKVLGDLRWLGNRETPAVLSILVVEDLAMAAYLPIVAVLLLDLPPLRGALSTLLAVATTAVVLALALRKGALFSRWVAHASSEVLLLTVLGALLLVGAGAERLQVSSGVGAFLLGVALTGEVADDVRALLGPLRDLFAATFFLFFTLEIDPRTLPPVLPVALGIALVTAATKIATGWWAARQAGVAIPGRVRAGMALVARGEFSIVLAGLGVSAGLEPRLGPLAATYVLLTAAAGPVLTRLGDPLGRWAQRRWGTAPRRAAPAPVARWRVAGTTSAVGATPWARTPWPADTAPGEPVAPDVRDAERP
jgi:CPA2 family monovalent cation:H+ antiporter-2